MAAAPFGAWQGCLVETPRVVRQRLAGFPEAVTHAHAWCRVVSGPGPARSLLWSGSPGSKEDDTASARCRRSPPGNATRPGDKRQGRKLLDGRGCQAGRGEMRPGNGPREAPAPNDSARSLAGSRLPSSPPDTTRILLALLPASCSITAIGTAGVDPGPSPTRGEPGRLPLIGQDEGMQSGRSRAAPFPGGGVAASGFRPSRYPAAVGDHELRPALAGVA
jgi:hypothetical protein